ncbi:hypothetical protein [Nocardiopsis sp. LOL_012]
MFDSAAFWVILFALPFLAIGVIIALAMYQASGVQHDERDEASDDAEG